MEFSIETDPRKLEALQKEKFDYKRLDILLTEITADLSDINPELFWKILMEFVKIINEMSSVLSLAFQAITSKVDIMKKNYADIGYPKIGLLSFVSREMELNIHWLDGNNNNKLNAAPKYANYKSTARSLMKMTWFLDFLSVLLGSLGKNQKASLSECISAAYTAALGPHHSFVLRQVAKVAMAAAPSRKTFEESLFPDLTSESLRDTLSKITEKINKIRGVIGKFYIENKLTKLP